MITKLFSFRNAYEILTSERFPGVLDDLLWACKALPMPLYPRKSAKQPKLDFVQQVANSILAALLEARQWSAQPDASDESFFDELRADFRKEIPFPAKGTRREHRLDSQSARTLVTQVEVEFGNAASIYRDIFKFQLSYANNRTDLGVLIVPEHKIATRVDSGVANYEKAVRELLTARSQLGVPILVIGLFEDNGNVWKLRQTRGDSKVWKSSSKECELLRRKLVLRYLSKRRLISRKSPIAPPSGDA